MAAPLLYAVGGQNDLLRTIDASDASTLTTQAITVAGETVQGAVGLARQPGSGTLYALLKLQGNPNRILATVDPDTGVATAVGDTGDKFSDIAFASNGTLYAVTGDNFDSGTGEQLYTLDLTDASASFVMALGNGEAGEVIGFNPNDGFLYHGSGDSFDFVFERIDLDTLMVTDVPVSGDEYDEMAGLGWGFDGSFYMTDIFGTGGVSDLYRITPGGAVTRIGDLGFDRVRGLVLVPEPGAALLLGAGLALLAAGRRRR